MKLKTDIKIQEYPFKLGLKTKVLTIGSCFSDVLHNFLDENKIESYSTNFGNIYNLISISKILQNLNTEDLSRKIIEGDGVFYHYDFHSDIRAKSKKELIELIEKLNLRTQNFLSKIDVLTLTLGTSWVYKLKDTGEIVANCHKQLASKFEKILLNTEDQFEEFKQLYNYLKRLNPKLKIILTVSPVRHIKDGIVNNNLSKSILRVLCHLISESFENTYYFPSYEIMIDDLRDYRFYSEDLIHPSKQAESYILELFSEALFDSELKEFIKIWTSIKSSINHTPFNMNSKNHQNFIKNTLSKLEEISKFKNVDSEKEILEKQLS